MPNVCILTDSTAQFTQSNFPGHERVHVIPFDLQTNDLKEVKSLPGGFAVQKQLIPPSPQEFILLYLAEPHLAALLGSRSIGLAIMEAVE
jgi:hypothetical protein